MRYINKFTENKKDDFDFNNTLFMENWDDWSGCYINGKLIDEGHSLNISNIFNKLCLLKVNFSYIRIYSLEYTRNNKSYIEDDDAMYFGWHMPSTMSELYNGLVSLGFDVKIVKKDE